MAYINYILAKLMIYKP